MMSDLAKALCGEHDDAAAFDALNALLAERDQLREALKLTRLQREVDALRIKGLVADKVALEAALREINTEAYDTTSGNVSLRTSRIMEICRDALGVKGEPGNPPRALSGSTPKEGLHGGEYRAGSTEGYQPGDKAWMPGPGAGSTDEGDPRTPGTKR